jgi:hypothetical protein
LTTHIASTARVDKAIIAKLRFGADDVIATGGTCTRTRTIGVATTTIVGKPVVADFVTLNLSVATLTRFQGRIVATTATHSDKQQQNDDIPLGLALIVHNRLTPV